MNKCFCVLGPKGGEAKVQSRRTDRLRQESADVPVVEEPAADLLSVSKNPLHPLPSSHCLDNLRVLHKSQWLDIFLFIAELVYKGH